MPYAPLGDAEIYYEEIGDGPPLLLVSGLGGTASYWAPNIAALARHHRVILHDHRGTGRSTRWEGNYSVELLASDLAGLLGHLNLFGAALVGHSTGGAIGQVLAARMPERVGRLMLYASWAKLCPQMRQCMEVRQQLLRHGGAAAYHRASPLFLYPPRYLCESWPAIEQEIAANAAHGPTATILEARLRAVVDFDGAGYLPRITAPTRILVAQDDFLTPPVASEFLAERIRGAKLHVLAYGGHAASRTMSGEFNAAVLDFLAASV